MSDNDRNIRTLIICFVVALSVLVPMRISEAFRESQDQVKVLGEEYFFEEESMVEVYTEAEEIILPNAE